MGSGASQPKVAPGSAEEAMLNIGEMLHDAEELHAKGNRDEAYALVAEVHALLPRVPPDETDQYATMIYSREGKMYFNANDFTKATKAYGIAIQKAEIRIAERCRGLYLLLQRYAECITDQVKIWKLQAEAAYPNDEKARNKAYGNCELALLRCIEIIEEGHNRRSDLLILPLTRLSILYENLKLYKRAELLLRRCQGVIIVQFGYDHHDLKRIDAKLKILERLNEDQSRAAAVVKIQSIARMRREMKRVGALLNKRMRRHELAPPAIRNERDKGEFLTKISGQLDVGTAMGHQVVDESSAMIPTPIEAAA